MFNDLDTHQKEYPPETAGRLLVGNVPIVLPNATLKDVEELFAEKGGDFESINYVYVCDDKNVLQGVFSAQELFRHPKAEQVKNIMKKDFIAVRAKMDQEKVALTALRENIKAVPVTDKDGKLLGVVTSNVILRVLHNENVEDALRFAGAARFSNPAVNIVKAGAWFHFKKRIPWLVLGLLGGIAAAIVVRFFEGVLAEEVLLAAFIPAVVYMADAVGAQAQIIFIRSLALSHSLKMRSYLLRELGVGFLLAVSLGALAFVGVGLWVGVHFGLIFGLTIVLTIAAAMIVAIGLPWALSKMGYDPAVASGPFATVIRDIASILIYFGVALLLL